MKVRFTPTEVMMAYHSDTLMCPSEGIYECSEEKAAQILGDFPLNFSAVAEDKAQPKPTHDRMEKKASRNK